MDRWIACRWTDGRKFREKGLFWRCGLVRGGGVVKVFC